MAVCAVTICLFGVCYLLNNQWRRDRSRERIRLTNYPLRV
jgi:hypothetical protein